MLYNHTCYNCKIEFISKNKLQLYCCRSCAAKARKHGRPKDIILNLNCKNCGKKIISKKIGQEFCNKSCSNSYNTRARKVPDNSIFSRGLNQDNCYILGLIWSDGCLSFDKHSKRYRITIAMNDEEIINKIHDMICPNKKLYVYKHPNGRTGTYYVISHNEADIRFLRELGLCERKSKNTKIPELPEHSLPHFVRGLFDGDGCVYTSNKTDKAIYLAASFTTGSYLLATGLRDLFLSKGWEATIVMDSRSKNTENPTYYVKLNRQADVADFKTWIYQESHLYLKRKYVKFFGDEIV